MSNSKNNLDLFVSFVGDVRGKTKELQDFMSHNWFSLKKGRTKSIEHYFGEDKSQYVKVYSAGSSIATIWDNDFLLYVITQLRRAMDRGEDVRNGKFAFNAYDYFTFRNRELRDLRGKSKDSFEKKKNLASGQHYKDLWKSLERLHETHVKTNITAGGITYTHAFVWLSEIKKIEQDGRAIGIEVQVSDWLVKRVEEEKKLLTFDDAYFGLKGGIERWLFLFCRKSCGHQRQWREDLHSVWKKSASTSEFRKFKFDLKKIVAKGDLLDYSLLLEGDTLVINRVKSYVVSSDKNLGRSKKVTVASDKVAKESMLTIFDILQKKLDLGG
jgi:plasmid replication initiation protein